MPPNGARTVRWERSLRSIDLLNPNTGVSSTCCSAGFAPPDFRGAHVRPRARYGGGVPCAGILAANMETTLVLIKPGAVSRGLVGEVTRRIEARGLCIRGMKLVRADKGLVERHYAEHQGKPFFDGVCAVLTSGPLVALAVGGENAIVAVRATMGATDPAKAAPGTVRGDLAHQIGDNVVHSSSDPEAAARELALWFPEGLCG